MIQTFDLSKKFGDYWAVDSVDLDVKPGQVLAILGQNGAGKTTTVRMLTSVLIPTRGCAIINGFDVVDQPERVRSSVGVLTEQHGLYLRMTGEEYLDYYGQIYGLAASTRKERCREQLEYFDLATVSTRKIGEYSKGMRQKLALARTLIHDPPVLLLDEPTSAMDPEAARLVRTSISTLRSANRAIIICTHNLAEAELLADHVAIIYRGRILTSGTVAELKTRYLGAAMYDVCLRNPWKHVHLDIPDGVNLISETKRKLRFRVVYPEKSNPELLKQVIGNGGEVITMQEVPRSLEEVYLAVMSKAKDD